ncbi:MFS transporter [Gordonia soli]|uniref:Putative major facilitator superfamily transporter n=1 Tax=Gordonia soli NBRC 108243 TaxID=1223545 RepID=M0QP27_9ACTN|nr:MFS transporter [Gordonia soli]GAC70395.1 putative major facilitator superfamily transporter [Gordonia soli NBRC 108243]
MTSVGDRPARTSTGAPADVDADRRTILGAGARPLRSLASTVYIPAGAYGIGQGAAASVMVLAAIDMGAGPALAGLTVAVVGLGQVVGDLFAGQVVGRLGERRSIILASSIALAGVLACLFAPVLAVLYAGILAVGLANAVWGLARQNYLSLVVPIAWRARAMSMFGGAMRFGFFVGPMIGAGAIALLGVRGGFVVQLIAVLVAGALMARLPDPDGAGASASTLSLAATLRRHRRLLATLGMGSLLLGVARAARDSVLPLWSDHLGASPATASLIFAAGAAIDVACAYPAGHLMDRFGRTFVAIPSILLLASAYLLIPFTTTLWWYTVVAIVLGVGNGFGNGVIMTIGADVAPATGRAEFLAVWRLSHDAGFLAGPLSIAGLAAIAPLAVAVFAASGLSMAGAILLARFVPRYTTGAHLASR